jgi:sarcosine oxidase, subunit gamma
MGPTEFARRSPLWRRLKADGAQFEEIENAAVAAHFGRPEDEAAAARAMALADLSPCPRYGFKGRGALDWLRLQGVRGLDEDNKATEQYDGARALRLSPGEALLLPGLEGKSAFLSRAVGSWTLDGAPDCYQVPRADSHYWFVVSGEHAAAMFAKICAVDLRAAKFESGRVAQTSVARNSAIVARRDLGQVPAFDVLGDWASAAYLWDCLLDAMAEFDGRVVGLAALRALAG